jgi:hypothetical protein
MLLRKLLKNILKTARLEGGRIRSAYPDPFRGGHGRGRSISVTQRPSWSNKLVESQSCSTSASRFCASSWQSRSNNGFLKYKMKLAICEGVEPLSTRDRKTDASSTRIFSHSGVWMSLQLPCPTAMWSNYRHSWRSERNSLALIKSSGLGPVFCSSLSQSASSCALCISRISAIVLLLVSSIEILSCLAIGMNLYERFLLGIASHARTKGIFWRGHFWV